MSIRSMIPFKMDIFWEEKAACSGLEVPVRPATNYWCSDYRVSFSVASLIMNCPLS